MRKEHIMAIGLALGAGLMYFLDPERGARRRALVRDKLLHTSHELEDRAVSSVRRARNRAIGIAHETRAQLTEGAVDDVVLVERVRSELGRAVANPKAINVTAERGHVVVSGRVLAADVRHILRAVKSVRGVALVDNQLEVHASPAAASDLQGAAAR